MTANAPPDPLIESADPDSSDPRPSTFTLSSALVRTLRWLLEGFSIYGLTMHGYCPEQVMAADHNTGPRRRVDHGPGATP
ncbi:hypothetical protein ACQP0C_06795 [Nocardia sp. CA-129566]|uniref:hypothetical protein n=1 Tax=Nocardia sp. CA-129566 TaxID=3239976 RepID=UPI003D994238